MISFNNHLKNFRILLGSRSPRRSALLSEAGIDFELWLKEEVPEIIPEGLTPDEAAFYLARMKSEAYRDELKPGEILITADTLVVLGDRILGKPTDADDAVKMLSDLSGNPHDVITGVCLTSTTDEYVFTDTTTVWFDTLSREEIRNYIDAFNPLDKAGAYGIQEWIGFTGVRKIDGSYFNVMGLPVQRVYRELQRFTGYI